MGLSTTDGGFGFPAWQWRRFALPYLVILGLQLLSASYFLLRHTADTSAALTVFPLDEVDLADLGAGTDSGIAATLRLRYVDFELTPAEAKPEEEDNTPGDADDLQGAETRPNAERDP